MVLPPGMSVRAMSHAKMTESIIAGIKRTTERMKLIHSALSVPGSEKALIQLPKP